MQDAQWWYANSRQSEGPVDLAGLRRLQQDGTVTARTLLWREGMPSWRPLAELDPAVAAAGPVAQPPEPAGVATTAADPSDPYRAPTTAALPTPATGLEGDMALYAAVVGGNFPIYRQRWRLDQGIATGSGTWHWPAFLIGLIWMMYRRMYRLAAIWAGTLVFFSIAEALLGVPEGMSMFINFVLNITAAVYANRWYLSHCQREITRARVVAGDDAARLRSELVARGGTSVPAAVGAIFFVLVMMFVAQAMAG
ncbi:MULTISPECIES: GYF domain-containing protein [Bacteria]|uniref:GYF domain-containing protein n=1 Tax=Bacteria TaxID=2 RepID=UPI0006AA208B|nr:GYF domain-containing protein [Stenotrophomonas maltophilia]ALA84421.1 hypothetical protein VN11_21475 [Stenotrophomonas maltophilia]MBA0433825.1 DUF4339 domain-containing protein [Stenotrophomonas maltophilia]MBH1480187.1 DUF4339 domain-containing protein [Stenotrophomonas maltophilia]MBH1505588.1 DUF4339 domain-containing protein [Stenotrophomonas maltophilia]MBH1785670.1 DUF4339 domain-containing protein [Stenotrophomonas maltophilia]